MINPDSNRTFPKASWFVVLGFLVAFAPTVRAIESGSTYDTTSPGNAPWNYVGLIGDAGGVYLGDYDGTNWVLTAAHVGLGNFTLGGITYDAIGGSAFSITNSDDSLADLTLFQISGSPGLANLTIASSEQSAGTTVEMIGYGIGSERGESWGINTIFGYGQYALNDTPYGGAGIFTLASGEDGNGAQAVSGDSGGGMFYKTLGGTWVLAGIISGAGDISIGDTNYGNSTVAVDLSAYSTQIIDDIDSVTAVPEPSTYAWVVGVCALGGAAIIRRRALSRAGAV